MGFWKSSLLVRLGEEQAEDALLEPHVGPFDVTGKAMRGWAMVAAEGLVDEGVLKGWEQRAIKFVGKLPGK